MKKTILSSLFLALFLMSTTSMADRPSKELVKEYISANHTKVAVEASIEAFAKQYAKANSPEQLAQTRQLMTEAIGWEALQEQYTAMIQDTFTSKEIKASIAFLRSPEGKAISKKREIFASKLANFMGENAQLVAAKMNYSPVQDNEDITTPPESIVISELEEHQETEHTYFTGKLTNNGKKAIQNAYVEVNLFLGTKFVDQYSTYISGRLAPNGERYFKVNCGCKDSHPAHHDNFKATVTEGY